MENKEIMRENMKKKEAVHGMKVNYEKAIEVNNEHKVNVDEQKDDIKKQKTKKHCDTYDKDEVQEITASRNPMKKNRPVCLTCN